jgi:hypothetical protein
MVQPTARPLATAPRSSPHPSDGRHAACRGRLSGGLGLLPLTVPEVRRLLVALVWTTPVQSGFVLAWSYH